MIYREWWSDPNEVSRERIESISDIEVARYVDKLTEAIKDNNPNMEQEDIDLLVSQVNIKENMITTTPNQLAELIVL